jgi:hypothetical protein
MERSRAEVERTLVRYGASGFAYSWERREVRPPHPKTCECRGSGRYTTWSDGRPATVDPERPCWRQPHPFAREVVIVGFKMPVAGGERRVQLEVPMPHEIEVGTKAKAEAATRQRWRALVLVLKAKLEAVASGISTLEAEFLANVVMADGRTIGAAILPRLTEACDTGRLLPAHEG